MSESEKIILPEELQIKMLEFFMKTSIPKNIKKNALLSINEQEKEGIQNEDGNLCEGVD